MALSTYTELRAAVADWLHRSDMSSVIVDAIALTEEKLNRRLRTKRQETALAETTIDASYQIAIPSNTLAVKRLWRSGSVVQPLEVMTLDSVVERQARGDLAYFYAVEGDYLRFDGTGSVTGVLYRSIPALSTAATNWVLTSYPSAYLYGALAECFKYTRDMEGMALYEAQAEGKISEIQRIEGADGHSGPLRIQAR